MDITTGRYTELDLDPAFGPDPLSAQSLLAAELKAAAAELEADPGDVVLVRGELRQVEALGERVRLGAAEQERRRARRKQQKASRKQHR